MGGGCAVYRNLLLDFVEYRSLNNLQCHIKLRNMYGRQVKSRIFLSFLSHDAKTMIITRNIFHKINEMYTMQASEVR